MNREALLSAVVRILDRKTKRRTIGTGFVVGPSLVATCAHVVEEAGGRPGETVPIAFLHNGGDAIDALVVADLFRRSNEEDIALLRIKRALPAGASAVALGQLVDSTRQLYGYGFPSGEGKGGLGACAKVVGKLPLDGRLQLQSQEIAPGFSGGPLLDETLGIVVGMIQAIRPADEFGRNTETAFANTAEQMRAVCAELSFLSIGKGASAQPDWEIMIATIARLFSEADRRVDSDPVSAALRAQQAIEQIVAYLHSREIGIVGSHDSIAVKVTRLEIKNVIPWHVRPHIDTVSNISAAALQPRTTVHDPVRQELEPCLLSLENVVTWFFRSYLNRPNEVPVRRRRSAPRAVEIPSSLAPPVSTPDVTPTNHTSQVTGTRVGTGVGEFFPVWRSTKAGISVVHFDIDDDGHSGRATLSLVAERTYLLGGQPDRKDGAKNDLFIACPNCVEQKSRRCLGSKSVSQDAAALAWRHGDLVVTNTSNRDNMYVRAELVPKGRARILRHGDTLQLGRVTGRFVDGRYYAATPASMVDPATGLMSREGIISEIGRALASSKTMTLFASMCTPGVEPAALGGAPIDPEIAAAKAAMAVHKVNRSWPMARVGPYVVAIVDGSEQIAACQMAAAAASATRVVSGYVALRGSSDEAAARVEACLGALTRMSFTVRKNDDAADLSNFALVPAPLDQLHSECGPLLEAGGGVILFALSEIERLDQIGPHVRPALELELFEMLGKRVGPKDLVAVAGNGRVLFGTPGDPARLAREIAVEWHSRGPVSAAPVEIDRALSTHLLSKADLGALPERVESLLRGSISALGLEGFPAPLAAAADLIDGIRSPHERLLSLIAIVDEAWRFLFFVLRAAARPVVAGPDVVSPKTWREGAVAAAALVTNAHPRLQELASIAASANQAIQDHQIVASAADLISKDESDDAAHSILPAVERSVRDIMRAFGPLRGWTLVSVTGSEYVDDGVTQRIEYLDYTGANRRGTAHRITASGFRGLARFVYLVRWHEGLSLSLEPFARRARNPVSGRDEIVLAATSFADPGMHRFCPIGTTQSIDLQVTAKQLGV